MRPLGYDVRFTPNSGHVQRTGACPLCANSGHFGATAANIVGVLFRAALAICLANRHTVGSTVSHLAFLRALFKTRLL
jgi:hypothetical protein